MRRLAQKQKEREKAKRSAPVYNDRDLVIEHLTYDKSHTPTNMYHIPLHPPSRQPSHTPAPTQPYLQIQTSGRTTASQNSQRSQGGRKEGSLAGPNSAYASKPLPPLPTSQPQPQPQPQNHTYPQAQPRIPSLNTNTHVPQSPIDRPITLWPTSPDTTNPALDLPSYILAQERAEKAAKQEKKERERERRKSSKAVRVLGVDVSTNERNGYARLPSEMPSYVGIGSGVKGKEKEKRGGGDGYILPPPPLKRKENFTTTVMAKLNSLSLSPSSATRSSPRTRKPSTSTPHNRNRNIPMGKPRNASSSSQYPLLSANDSTTQHYAAIQAAIREGRLERCVPPGMCFDDRGTTATVGQKPELSNSSIKSAPVHLPQRPEYDGNGAGSFRSEHVPTRHGGEGSSLVSRAASSTRTRTPSPIKLTSSRYVPPPSLPKNKTREGERRTEKKRSPSPLPKKLSSYLEDMQSKFSSPYTIRSRRTSLNPTPARSHSRARPATKKAVSPGSSVESFGCIGEGKRLSGEGTSLWAAGGKHGFEDEVNLCRLCHHAPATSFSACERGLCVDCETSFVRPVTRDPSPSPNPDPFFHSQERREEGLGIRYPSASLEDLKFAGFEYEDEDEAGEEAKPIAPLKDRQTLLLRKSEGTNYMLNTPADLDREGQYRGAREEWLNPTQWSPTPNAQSQLSSPFQFQPKSNTKIGTETETEQSKRPTNDPEEGEWEDERPQTYMPLPLRLPTHSTPKAAPQTPPNQTSPFSPHTPPSKPSPSSLRTITPPSRVKYSTPKREFSQRAALGYKDPSPLQFPATPPPHPSDDQGEDSDSSATKATDRRWLGSPFGRKLRVDSGMGIGKGKGREGRKRDSSFYTFWGDLLVDDGGRERGKK